MSDSLTFPAGVRITFTQGAYDDYALISTAVTLKPVDIPALALECASQWSPREAWDNDSPSPEDFYVWMVKNGYVANEAIQEVNLGANMMNDVAVTIGDYEPPYGLDP